MRVAFLSDQGNADGTIGGAELTMQEFAKAAPDGVELVPPLRQELMDAVVIGNCVSYGPDLVRELVDKRVVWFHNDLSPWIDSGLKVWLDTHAEHIFCSPLQRERYGLDGHLIPPAIDLDRFTPTRQIKRNGKRQGMVSVGAWQNPGKGQQSLLEYAQQHGEIDVYGTGQYAPKGHPLRFKGPISQDDLPQTLWAYSEFVHLPWDVEPFGRCVVEAWAAGLEIVTNKLVGATYWLERPDKLRTAASDFWAVVCG